MPWHGGGARRRRRRLLYLKTPPDAETLRAIVAKLEDPVTDLVRRDSLWKKLGLTDDDARTEEQVIDLLVRHKQLLQRPVVVTDARGSEGAGARAAVGLTTRRYGTQPGSSDACRIQLATSSSSSGSSSWMSR